MTSVTDTPLSDSTRRVGPSDVYWFQVLQRDQLSRLASLRTDATAWGTTVSALIGIFTTLAIFKGPSTLASLEQPLATIAVAALISAAVSAVGALFFASMANRTVTHQDLQAALSDPKRIEVEYADKIMSAARWLARSRNLGILMVAALFVTVGIGGLGPTSTTTRYLATDSDGRVHCGVLFEQQGASELAVGANLSLPLASVTGLTAVSSCGDTSGPPRAIPVPSPKPTPTAPPASYMATFTKTGDTRCGILEVDGSGRLLLHVGTGKTVRLRHVSLLAQVASCGNVRTRRH